MEAASIADLKKSLVRLDHDQLLDAVLRLARFKKDNKQLLTYLLFLSDNEQAYANSLCREIDEQFALTPNAHKKTLRKMIRNMDKCLRFTSVKETHVQVRIHFCRSLKASDTPIFKTKVVANMFYGQLKKIKKLVDGFHEDIAYQYLKELADLEAIV